MAVTNPSDDDGVEETTMIGLHDNAGTNKAASISTSLNTKSLDDDTNSLAPYDLSWRYHCLTTTIARNVVYYDYDKVLK
ncbi:hypothetical protein JHK86_016179 [Glycine max]|nr:hypothetical protein JHK86_016179 [Glycine max]